MEENIYYIYAHFNLLTGKIFYIGKGKNDRLNSKNRRSVRWHNYTNKYGYIAKRIEENLTEKEAFAREMFYIQYYGRKDHNMGELINMSDGGAGGNNNKGKKLSEEWKKNMAIARDKSITLRRELGLIGKPKKILLKPDTKIGTETNIKIFIKLDPNGNPVTHNRGMKMADWALEAREQRPKIMCEYCGEIHTTQIYTKLHGSNCKFNPKNVLNPDYQYTNVKYGEESKLSKLSNEIAMQIVIAYNTPVLDKTKGDIARELAEKYEMYPHYIRQLGGGSKRPRVFKEYLRQLSVEDREKLLESRQTIIQNGKDGKIIQKINTLKKGEKAVKL